MAFLGTRGAASSRGFGSLARTGTPPGQQAYTTAGTFTWVCPAGVTSVCAVVIGAGGGGCTYAGFSGGNLAYKNNIAVTPGASYTVVVGQGGLGVFGTTGNIGGQSYFIDPNTLQAFGGHQGSVNPPYVGDGGGQGGSGGTFKGGGGAAGYTGNGGAGGDVFNNPLPQSGSGGGGGGGGSNGYTSDPYTRYYRESAGGGGVGFLGQGANGAAGTNTPAAGTGGSAGSLATGSFATNGQNTADASGTDGGAGGDGGGGGGCGFLYYDEFYAEYVEASRGGNGGTGRVRIIWGAGRSFPATNTGNV